MVGTRVPRCGPTPPGYTPLVIPWQRKVVVGSESAD